MLLTKLRNKFLILNMSIISVLMIIAFATIYLTTYNNIQSENQNKLHSLSAIRTTFQQTENVVSDGTKKVIITFNNIPPDYSLSFNIQVNSDGEINKINSFIDLPDEIYREAADLAWNHNKNNSVLNLGGKQWQYAIKPVTGTYIIHENGQQYTVNTKENKYQITFLDITDTNKTLMELLITFLFVGVIMLFVIFAISLYFANHAIKPIAEVWEKQKQFIADASHELKTPLAIINANSDALLANQEATIKSQKKWLDYIKAETERMAKLIGDLLYLAKTEDTKVSTLHATFDISSTVSDVILSMEAIVFEQGIKLSHEIEPGITAKGEPDTIKQVVMILLDNAIKYTNQKGHIDIMLKKTKRQIVFSIQNSGNGIQKQDLPKLFDRFYRADPSRTQESGGYGLGLPIAKAMVDRLNGRIYAASVENESVTFTFILAL